jgi:hypothetical protein
MYHHKTRRFIAFLLFCVLSLQALPALAQGGDVVSPDDFIAQLDDLRANEPTYSEGFRVPNTDWEIDTESDNSSIRFEGRTYRIDAIDTDLFVWGISPAEAANFYVEVYADRVAGPLNNEFGIVFRHVDTDNFYAFMASSDGYYVLRTLEDGEWSDIIPWTASDAIDQEEGAANLVGVYADGPMLLLLINDTVVDWLEDATFAEGGLALAAGSFDEGDVQIAFDDFALWDLDNFGTLTLPDMVLNDAPPVEPGDEPTDEPTVAPTAQPGELSAEASAAILNRVDAVREESATLSENFSRDSGAWEIGEDEQAEIAIARRALSLHIIDSNWLGWSTLLDVQAADLLMEADFRLDEGAPETESGIIFRFQDEDNFYYFAVSGDGMFSLWRLVDNAWEELLPWSANDALDGFAGAVNRLSVLAEGETISLLINDTAVGQVQDGTFGAGLVGLAVGTFEEGNATVIADNVDLWVLSTEPLDGPAPDVTETPEPEVTPETIETPEATETPEADVPAPEGDVLFRLDEIRSTEPSVTSDFRRDDGAWSMDAEEGVTHTYARRALHITVDRDDWVSWSKNQEIDTADFVAEVDAGYVAGPIGAEYGLVFRYVDDQNLYLYVISSDGYYSLFRRLDGQWEALVPWTQESTLNIGDGALNRLGVLAEGPVITLYVNDGVLTTIEDDAIVSGRIGLAAGTFDEPGLEVFFDNFSFWEIDNGG